MFRYKDIKTFYQGQLGFISNSPHNYRLFGVSSMERVVVNMRITENIHYQHLEQHIKIEGKYLRGVEKSVRGIEKQGMKKINQNYFTITP